MKTYAIDPRRRTWVQTPAYWILVVLFLLFATGVFPMPEFGNHREKIAAIAVAFIFVFVVSYIRFATSQSITLTDEGKLIVTRRFGTQEILVSEITRIRALALSWKGQYQIKHLNGTVMILESLEGFDDLYQRLRELNPDFKAG